jgi:hypothetical protein
MARSTPRRSGLNPAAAERQLLAGALIGRDNASWVGDVRVAWGFTRGTEITIPSGTWRARWSGFGERALEHQESEGGIDAAPRPDRYVLQLWPTDEPGAVARLSS